MDASLTGVELGPNGLTELAESLAANRLPADDLAGADKRFFAFVNREGARVGFGGIERHGADALLRSVVTLEGVRRRGYGRAIVDWLARHAAGHGIGRLYLLTVDAAAFFERCGFARCDRRAVPAEIAGSALFTTHCPTTAVCMVRELSGPGVGARMSAGVASR